MSQIVKDMRSIYRLKHYDFMGYTFRNVNQLSYHHIHKACDGGEKSYDNGAILRQDTSHQYIHIIEDRDFDMFVYINRILKEINEQQAHPTKAQLLAIRNVLLQFEREHSSDRNSKGKLLIKERFIKERIDL